MCDELLIAILAAGASRRLGQPKQLVSLGGAPLIRRQCRMALDSGIGPVAAIVGCHAEQCGAALGNLPVEVLDNPFWSEGLASSIRTATLAAMSSKSRGVLIFHCDQYRITARDLQLIHHAWVESEQSAICRARHRDYAGPPTIFPERCLSELLLLEGDRGARQWMETRAAGSLIDISLPNAADDLDLPERLAELQSIQSWEQNWTCPR